MHLLTSLLLSVSILTVCAGCSQSDPVRQIDPEKTEQVQRVSAEKQTNGLHIAVGGMITPREGFAYYKHFLDYISERLGQPIYYMDAENYADINHKLKSGAIDAGFVCSGPYVDGRKEFGLELLAAPRAYGKLVYHAYIIVPANSTARQLNDLKGKRFAFTDPLSNSGKLVPEYMLKRRGYSPERFFSTVVYSGSHDKSISAVSQGLVDGASVDSLIWQYAHRNRPELTANTRIIQTSEPYAMPPFVVRPGLDPKVKGRLREILLTAHTDPKGKAIMSKMMIDRFETIDDSAYNSVREMKKNLDTP
jgi:phosphonate transport system substrate-binding protein